MSQKASAMRGRGNRLLKWCDRHIAVWLVLLVAVMRRRRSCPKSIRRIALVKTAAIGDSILLLPVVMSIVEAFPRAECVLFLGPGNAQVRPLYGLRTEVVPISNPIATWRTIRRFDADVIIDFEPWARISAVICVLAGRFSLGFRCPGQFKHAAFDRAVPHHADCHEIENYRRIARSLGVRSLGVPRLLPRDRRAGESLRQEGRRFIVLHPWPGGFMSLLREWPSASWIEIARRSIALGIDVLVSGAPADVERSAELCALVGFPDRCRSIAGSYKLSEMVDVLSSATAIIAVNTGIMHLAAATSTPVLALNGPTNPRRWGALGAHACNINAELPGCGFLNLGFEVAGNRCDCMESISVERVWQALQPHLSLEAAS